MDIFNKRTSRKIGINCNFKYVSPGIFKIPEVIIRFIKEIEPVQPLNPTYTHFYIKVLEVKGYWCFLCIVGQRTAVNKRAVFHLISYLLGVIGMTMALSLGISYASDDPMSAIFGLALSCGTTLAAAIAIWMLTRPHLVALHSTVHWLTSFST